MEHALPNLERPLAPRYATLDAWRGLAALLVVLYHATATWRTTAAASSSGLEFAFRMASQNGWLGVPLFFVISGYCIAAAADSSRRKPDSVRQYVTRRIRRIYPPFGVWLICMTAAIFVAELLLPTAGFWQAKEGFVPISRMEPEAWVANLGLVHTWLPKLIGFQEVNITAVSWTLCYEVQFYAVIGVLLACVPRRLFPAVWMVTTPLVLLFMLLPQAGLQEATAGTFLDGRWLQFAMGVGVYQVTNYQRRWNNAVIVGLMAIAAVCIPATYQILLGEELMREKRVFELGFCAVFAIMLLLLKPLDEQISASKSIRPWIWCGVISYSLYLVHWPLCKLLALATWRFGLHSTAETVLITVPLCTVGSLAVASVFYRLIESRCLDPVRVKRSNLERAPTDRRTDAIPGTSRVVAEHGGVTAQE